MGTPANTWKRPEIIVSHGSGNAPDSLPIGRYGDPVSQCRIVLGVSAIGSWQKLSVFVPAVKLPVMKPPRGSSPSRITSNPFHVRQSSGAPVNKSATAP